MPIEPWGNLPKSQADNEKIEEAVARLIQAHEDDPNAHVEVGESLYSHKASAIIDHLVASIIADKVKDWEAIKIKGDLDRLDFHWLSLFESIAGFYKSVAGIVLDSEGRGVEFTTTSVAANERKLFKFLGLWSPVKLTWAKNRKFRIKVQFSQITNQHIHIGTGRILPVAGRHIGFKVIDDTLYGTMADGSTEETLNCGSIIAGNLYELEIDFIAGASAEFFVNTVSKGTLSTNVPTTGTDSSFLLWGSIITDENAIKEMQIGFCDLWQQS